MNNLEELYQEFGEQICLFPFMSAFYSMVSDTSPTVMPCSSISTTLTQWKIQNNSIIDSVNTPQWKSLRENFIKGSCHTSDICKTCSLAETNNGNSPRILNNKYFSEHIKIDLVPHIKQIIENNYNVTNLLSLDYCPSNYCNYECVMCFSGASSKRKIFEIKVLGIDQPLNKKFKVADDFEQILSTVQVLNFTGGETLLQKQIHKIIDYLIENNLSENITISLLTNASIYPKPLLDQFRQFKNVFYTVSIDGTGEVLEYQRRGAMWQEVENNSLRLIKNFGAVVNYVLTAINLLNFIDFVHWIHANQIDKVFISLVYERNRDISIAVVPPELRDPFIADLKENKQLLAGSYAETLIDQMLTILDNVQHDTTLIPKFIDAIRKEDSVSKKPFVDVVTEWRPYFDD